MNTVLATYYNLNKPYILLFFLIALILFTSLYWIISHTVAKRNIDACNDPVAQFFDKRMKQRCMAKQWSQDMGWFAEHMEDKFKLLHQTQDYLNMQVDNVLNKYTAENTADFNTALAEIKQQEAEMESLKNKALNTHALVVENKSMLQQLWNDWQQRLVEFKEKIRASLVAKRTAANNYVDQLNQLQRNKKAAKRRKRLVNKYDKTKKYLQKMQKNAEYADLDLTVNALSNEARRGKK